MVLKRQANGPLSWWTRVQSPAGSAGGGTGGQNSWKTPLPEAQANEVMACLVGTNVRGEPFSSGRRLFVRWKFEDKNTERRALAGVAQWTECQPVNQRVTRHMPWFPVRAHAWVAGQFPGWGCVRGHTLMFLFLSFSIPFPFSKNK